MFALAALLVFGGLLLLFLLPVALLLGLVLFVGFVISLLVDGSRTLVRSGVFQ